MMGSIKMVAMMLGSESALVGWVVHLLISALFGVGYSLLFGRLRNQWAAGLVYQALEKREASQAVAAGSVAR
ncbi:MAG: hypothetical protein ACOY93_10815 [Bacillota bacterium]